MSQRGSIVLGASVVAAVALAGLALAMLGAVPGISGAAGSGNVVVRDFNLTGFTSVAVGGGFTVSIIQGSQYSVRVTADDNLFAYLEVKCEGEALIVRPVEGASIRNPTALRVEVTMPAVSGVSLAAGSSGTLAGFGNGLGLGRLSIALAAGSRLEVRQAYVGSFSASLALGSRLEGSISVSGVEESSFNLAGGSSVRLTGTCSDISINAIGGSSLDLSGMAAHDVDAVLAGASSAKVSLDGTLNAKAMGASSLRYSGSPTLGSILVTDASSVGPA